MLVKHISFKEFKEKESKGLIEGYYIRRLNDTLKINDGEKLELLSRYSDNYVKLKARYNLKTLDYLISKHTYLAYCPIDDGWDLVLYGIETKPDTMPH